MAAAAVKNRKSYILGILGGVLGLVILAAIFHYLNKPITRPLNDAPATQEAKEYLPNLALSDVGMQATENFMNQRVVEVQGNITNKGPRKLSLIDVYCLFSGVDGAEIHRERLSVIRSGGGVGPLGSGETRAFRLPFDELPEGWNQAMPHLVIAQIKFAE